MCSAWTTLISDFRPYLSGEAQLLVLGVTLHEAHETLPLKLALHHVLGLDPVGLTVHELGLDIRGRQLALLVQQIQTCTRLGALMLKQDKGESYAEMLLEANELREAGL